MRENSRILERMNKKGKEGRKKKKVRVDGGCLRKKRKGGFFTIKKKGKYFTLNFLVPLLALFYPMYALPKPSLKYAQKCNSNKGRVT